MARNLENRTNVDSPTSNFPYGRTKNETVAGDGTGTKATEELFNDTLVFFQKLMGDSGITPNELPDNETNGYQILEAMKSLIISKNGFSFRAENKPITSQIFDCDYLNGTWIFMGTTPNSVGYLTSNDLRSFTTRTLDNEHNISKMVVGNNIVLAFALSDGKVYKSSDGITWTNHTFPLTNTIDCVYSETLGLFVAVSVTTNGGAHEHVATSPDGETWTERTASSSDSWATITEKNGTLVAATSTDDNKIMYSTDGTAWNGATLSGNMSNKKVSANSTIFMCVGSADATEEKVYTSSDGITWDGKLNIFYNNTGNDIYSVFSIGEIFHVIANIVFDSVNRNSHLTSSDGHSWKLGEMGLAILPNNPSNTKYGGGKIFGALATAGTGDKILVGE